MFNPVSELDSRLLKMKARIFRVTDVQTFLFSQYMNVAELFSINSIASKKDLDKFFIPGNLLFFSCQVLQIRSRASKSKSKLFYIALKEKCLLIICSEKLKSKGVQRLYQKQVIPDNK